MSKTVINIDIEADEEDGLYMASMLLEGERFVICVMPIAVEKMDSAVFEDFTALCIKIAKTAALSRGLIVRSYSIKVIQES